MNKQEIQDFWEKYQQIDSIASDIFERLKETGELEIDIYDDDGYGYFSFNESEVAIHYTGAVYFMPHDIFFGDWEAFCREKEEEKKARQALLTGDKRKRDYKKYLELKEIFGEEV